MATRTKAKPTAAALDDEEDLTPDFDLETFLEEIGSSASVVEVHRLKRDGGRPHLARVDLDVLRDDVNGYLRDTHGPGRYLLHFKDKYRRITASKTLEVEGGIEGGSAAAAARAPAAIGAAAPAESLHVQLMREQMAMQQNLLTTLLGTMRPPDLAPFVNVLTAGANRGPDPAALLTSVVGAIVALRQPAEASAGGNVWGNVTKVLELAQTLQPGAPREEGDTGWGPILRDVGKGIVEVIGAANATANGSRPVLPATAPPAGGDENMLQLAAAGHIRTAITYLKGKARAGKDVEIYVDQIFDNAEEPQWAYLLEAVRRGATFDHLCQFDPEIESDPILNPWFKELHANVHATLFPDPASGNGGVDPGRPGRNGDNATAHGGPGQPSGDVPSNSPSGERASNTRSN